MRKIKSYIIFFILILLLIGIFFGCNNKQEKYTISFVSNDKEYATREMEGTFVINLPVPELDNYIFEGWYFDKEYKEQFLATSFKDKPIEKNIVVYAKWRNINDCKITFENENLDELIVKKGEKIGDLPSPEKEGYTFYGWYLESQLKTLYNKNTIINNDVNLYAKWVSNNKKDTIYTITINNLSGDILEPIKVKYGEKIVFPENYNVGYKLDGYYTDIELTNEYINSPTVSSFELFTKWIKVDDIYKLTFFANGGSLIENKNVFYNTLLEMPISIRNGYKLEGWYTDNNFTYKFDFEKNRIKKDYVFYAKWEEEQDTDIPSDTVNIILEVNGGQCSQKEITIKKGETPILPQPENGNSEFAGWYLDEECENKYELGKVEEDLILYAGWKTDINDEEFEFEAVIYANSKECAITKYIGEKNKVEIPQTINDATVVAINDDAFRENTTITCVNMVNTITKIGDNAFRDCKKLVEINDYDGLKEIGDYAFYNTLIKSFVDKSGIESLGSFCFAESKLENVTLLNNIENGAMGNKVFYKCSKLKNVTINYLEYIPNNTFEWCEDLEEISLASCKKIGMSAFENSGLYSINIPNIEEIQTKAFASCKFESFDFNTNVILGQNIFEFNNNLVNINLGQNFKVNDIERVMENGAFYKSNYINFVDVDKNNPYYSTKNGSLLNQDGDILYCVGGLNTNGEIVIPEGVQTIKMFALNQNDGIISISLPKSLTEIESNALGGAKNLSKIEVDEENQTFEIKEKDSNYNGNLYKENTLYRYLPTNNNKEYTLLDTTTSIYMGAFADNEFLETININNLMETINYGAFYNSINLKEVNNLDNIKTIESYAFCNTKIEKIILGETITLLEDNCFYENESFNKLVIQNSTSIIDIGEGEYSNVTLEVSSELLDEYKTKFANKFKEIKAIIE